MNSGKPVHVVISQALKEQIISGELKPGNLLPSENTLKNTFSASRETVRKSLKDLENEGYIYSRPGKGYFVCTPEYGRLTLRYDEEKEDSSLRHIDVIAASEEVAQALNLSLRSRVIEIQRIVYKSRRPVAFELRYYPYDRGKPTVEKAIDYAVFPEIAAEKTSAFAFKTHMEISAANATEQIAEKLECPSGKALLLIRRRLIGPEDMRIGYGLKYMLPEYAHLEAESGLLLR